MRDTLIDFYSLFDAVSLDESFNSFDEVYSAVRNDKVSVLRNYYSNICEICRIIIDRRGVSFDKNGGDAQLNSIVLDMASIFEKYLLNSLRINRNIFPIGTSILDGNNEGRKKLYNQPSIGTGDAKPDIIFNIANNCLIIADAKYKLKTKEIDRYQVISHALSYGARIAVLILPKDEDYKGGALVKLGSIGAEHAINVYEYYFNLSSEDLVSEENKLSHTLLSLFAEI